MALLDTTLIATSVVRGSQQGDSHGGVYLIRFSDQSIVQKIDWNSGDIDFQGRGWDRGLRGIEFDNNLVYIVASDELFIYDSDFNPVGSYRNSYLKHAHEISCFGRNLFITSTGFNAVLAFDMDKRAFTWGMHVQSTIDKLNGIPFDPLSGNGPLLQNNHHLNTVFCNDSGMYLSGRGTNAMYRFNGRDLEFFAKLPTGVHNARPYKDGLVYNDTEENLVRIVSETNACNFAVPTYADSELTHVDLDNSTLARQGFGRGMCVISESLIAAGSSPSTISVYDTANQLTAATINLTKDVRNAIHGLEVWPF